ncbi:TBC1 domain family member 2A-like [Oreochromis niloticus]|uniref:TBC1 domain family member 2A-like n=1 Tax=Oreochromis niloticus TaxID=8128 RepID=UPI000DF15B71|nr:TBC1 domain family member 2A-like [Oreochromis niloticus]
MVSQSSDRIGHLQQEKEMLREEVKAQKDDIEAYETQNKFLNSEIYQLTKWWRKSSEQEKALMVKAAFLEATSCQVESRYLGVLRRLQEIKSLDPAQREAVQKMIEDALKGELKSVTKLSVDRYKHLNSRMDKITETSCLFLIQESLDMTIKNSEEETLYRPNFLLFTPNLLNVLNIRRVLRDHDEYGFKII